MISFSPLLPLQFQKFQDKRKAGQELEERLPVVGGG